MKLIEQKLREAIRNGIKTINERKGFKNTKNFADFLEEIDGMGESAIRKIMGKDYIDTPGFYQDEKANYDNDIIEFMLSNMGRKEYDKLEKYWDDNVAESIVTEKYNGWTNWDTWNANNWLTNDEGAYDQAMHTVDERGLEKFFIQRFGKKHDDINIKKVNWEEIFDGLNESKLTEAHKGDSKKYKIWWDKGPETQIRRKFGKEYNTAIDNRMKLLLSLVDDPDKAENYAEMDFLTLPDDISTQLVNMDPKELHALLDESVNVNESVIGVKTEKFFRPDVLTKALDKAKIKYKFNRLSLTLSVIDLDKKYFEDAKQVVDDLGLSVMMAKESKLTEGMSKSAIKKAIKTIDKQIDTETGGDGEPLNNETLQALEQERERLESMLEGKLTEAYIELDAIDPKNKVLLKQLKGLKVKMKVISNSGPGGGAAVVGLTGKREALEDVVSNPIWGWDDPELAEFIEERKVNEHISQINKTRKNFKISNK